VTFGVYVRITEINGRLSVMGRVSRVLMLLAISVTIPCAGAAELDKWALWVDGPHLRGANIMQRRVYPDLDGPTFFGPGPYGPPYIQRDFDWLATMGANYVNISHQGLFFDDAPYALDTDAQDNIDSVLEMIAAADMFAVISFRSGPGRSTFSLVADGVNDWFEEHFLNDTLWSDPAARAAFVEMWRHTAERYRDHPAVVGYDLLVEPNSNDVGADYLNAPLDIWEPDEFYAEYGGTLYDWNTLYPLVTQAIREVDQATPILIGGNAYSNVAWLEYVEPTGDPRTVYTAHQYEPQDDYTHVYWDDPALEDLSYPGTLDTDYDGVPDAFDRAWLADWLSQLQDYMTVHNAPVAVNEFGLMRWIPDGAAFIRDEMELFEELGVNYALWAWRSSWEPQREMDDFDIIRGPDAANHEDVETSALIEVVREFWSRNVLRPSMFSQATPTPWDVNDDGKVDIIDLVTVAAAFGTSGVGAPADANGDGVVNIVDLVTVASHFGVTTVVAPGAPRLLGADHRALLERWLQQARMVDDGSESFRRGIDVLERLLRGGAPVRTRLFPNYPNPFNPDTWIPFHVGEESRVTISIYDIAGRRVRTLSLGSLPTGEYTARGKAAHWDGKDDRGETVAGGVYVYELSSESQRAVRRMVVLK
jgi:hypothetical protein